MRINTKSIAVAAITVALTFVFGYLPFVFLVPLLFTASTRGLRMSLFIGLVFGCVSLMYAFMGSTPIAAAFVAAPYIPILPRIATAAVAHGAFVLSRKLIKGTTKARIAAPYVISAAAGTLSNTLFIVSLLVLVFRDTDLGGVTMILYVPSMLLMGLVELAINIAVVPAVAVSVQRALYGKRFFDNTSNPHQGEQQQNESGI